jgi:hypothetical protein
MEHLSQLSEQLTSFHAADDANENIILNALFDFVICNIFRPHTNSTRISKTVVVKNVHLPGICWLAFINSSNQNFPERVMKY